MMEQDSMQQKCREVIESAEMVVVTTLDEEQTPVSRAMFNLRRRAQFPDLIEVFEKEPGFLIYLCTNTSSEKIEHLRRNPAITLHYCVPARFYSVMLSGEAELTQDDALRKRLWQEDWTAYFPKGPDDPDYTVIRLQPQKMRGTLEDQAFEFELGTPA